VSPRRAVGLLAVGRTALGAGVLVAPEAVTSRWLGDNASHPAVRYLARSLGARDLALGVLALCTLDDARVAPQVTVACAVADSVDALATIAARAELPAAGAIGTVVVAGGAAVAGFYLAQALTNA
jgi:acetyl esterase/lipase